MRGIADTGLLVAFLNGRDRHHDWAVGIAQQVTEPLLTCEAVVAEASFHLRNTALVIRLISDGFISLSFEASAQVNRLATLAKRYSDREPDFADLCLICMSELYPQHSVITVDETDFRIYRRNTRERIPLVCPRG